MHTFIKFDATACRYDIIVKSKGSLKLLNVGKPKNNTNLEISYASKKAIEILEKNGGKIKLTKK